MYENKAQYCQYWGRQTGVLELYMRSKTLQNALLEHAACESLPYHNMR